MRFVCLTVSTLFRYQPVAVVARGNMEGSFGNLGTFWNENPLEMSQAAPRRPGFQIPAHWTAPGVLRIVRSEAFPPSIYLLPITKPFFFTPLALDHVNSFLTDTDSHECAHACLLFLCTGGDATAFQFVAPHIGISFPRLGKLLSLRKVCVASEMQRDFWSRFVWGAGLLCEQDTMSAGTLQASFGGYPTVLLATRRRNARKAARAKALRCAGAR